jgi:hypothetical protein
MKPAPLGMGPLVVGAKELDLAIVPEPNHNENICVAFLTILKAFEE